MVYMSWLKNKAIPSHRSPFHLQRMVFVHSQITVDTWHSSLTSSVSLSRRSRCKNPFFLFVFIITPWLLFATRFMDGLAANYSCYMKLALPSTLKWIPLSLTQSTTLMCARGKACAHTYSNCNRPPTQHAHTHTYTHMHKHTFWEMPVICILSSCVCVNTMGSVFSEGDIIQQREQKWEYCSSGKSTKANFFTMTWRDY